MYTYIYIYTYIHIHIYIYTITQIHKILVGVRKQLKMDEVAVDEARCRLRGQRIPHPLPVASLLLSIL